MTTFTEPLTHRSVNRSRTIHGTTHASFSGGREGKGREGKRRDGSDVLTPSVCIPKIDGVTTMGGVR